MASSTASTAGALRARVGNTCTLGARSVRWGCRWLRRAGTSGRGVRAGCWRCAALVVGTGALCGLSARGCGAVVRGSRDVDALQRERQREHRVCREHADGVSGGGGRVYGGSEHAADLERDQQRAEQQQLQHAVRQHGAGHGGRGGDVRLVLGDAVAPVDRDGAVRGLVLGRRYERRRRRAVSRRRTPARGTRSGSSRLGRLGIDDHGVAGR